MTAKRQITLGHSPDPDDAFMFYGLACGAVDGGAYAFEHIMNDIQTLNEWALEGRLDVTAISVHAYPYVQDKYAILSSGASMGGTELADYERQDGLITTPRGQTGVHGPLLVAREKLPLGELKQQKIAVPGKMTSAFLTLQLALGNFDYEIMTFDRIPDAVRDGKVAAGLLIHEAQLTFSRFGLHCLLDLGKWWYEQTSLPLPLGCNVIRRDLGTSAMQEISRILAQSIRYGLEHRREAVEYALQFGRGLDMALADSFVGMYVNEWTLDYGPRGRAAIKELLQRGHTSGLLPRTNNLDFIA